MLLIALEMGDIVVNIVSDMAAFYCLKSRITIVADLIKKNSCRCNGVTLQEIDKVLLKFIIMFDKEIIEKVLGKLFLLMNYDSCYVRMDKCGCFDIF